MKLMGDDIVVKLERYIDKNGIINVWPKKHEAKEAVLQYLSTKFEVGRDYTEKEVNSIIDNYHSFNDYFLLRRGLIDYKMLKRTRDGSRYWKEQTEE